MEPIEIIAQIIGIFGMTVNLLAYQQKKQFNLILFQFFGSGLFFLNFLLLGIADMFSRTSSQASTVHTN